MTIRTQFRLGISLIEVLISFFVLAVGVVSVITLFPVGISHITQAVSDTKCTILAIEAQNLIRLNNWPDDRYATWPPVQSDPVSMAPDPPIDTAGKKAAPDGGDIRGILPTTNPPFCGTRPAIGALTLPDNNIYATVINADGTAPALPASKTTRADQRMHPEAGAGSGFPVLFDPVLYNALAFQFDANNLKTTTLYKRVAIAGDQTLGGANFFSMDPFKGQLNDLVIHTLSDVQYQPSAPSTAAAPIFPSRRDAYLRQTFFAPDDVQFETDAPTIAFNPNRNQSTPLQGWRYVLPGDSDTATTPKGPEPPGYTPSSGTTGQLYNTAVRNDNYSWSFVLQNRALVPHPSGVVLPPGPNPAKYNGSPFLAPTYGQWDSTQLQILVFYKRPLANPYTLVRGCLFSGSRIATLSWDPAVVTEAPVIKRGSWLMEATISPGMRDATPTKPAGPAPLDPVTVLAATTAPTAPATAYVKYRQAFSFHRVSSVDDAVLNTSNSQMYQVVHLEDAVSNYPISHVLGDGRGLPDGWALNDFSSTNAATFSGSYGGKDDALPNVVPSQSFQGKAVDSVWAPIVLWQGLQEVYTVRN